MLHRPSSCRPLLKVASKACDESDRMGVMSMEIYGLENDNSISRWGHTGGIPPQGVTFWHSFQNAGQTWLPLRMLELIPAYPTYRELCGAVVGQVAPLTHVVERTDCALSIQVHV